MKHVLVVDDTKNIRTLLTTCLQMEGYKVTTASNGQDALNLFSQHTFDLAFLDIKMTEISGTEVLRHIRELGILTPVIIMTAFATVKNAVECTKLGAVAYLQKPFTAEKVRNVLKELAAEYYPALPNIEASLKLIKELIANERLEDASKNLKQILALDPGYSETYQLLGQIYEKQGNLKEADQFYQIGKHLGRKE